MRKGLAEVAAAAIRRAPNRTLCEEVLVALFDDESADVRQQTGRWLFDLEGDELGEFTDLVEALIDSRAFQDHTLGLMQALEKTTAKLPDVVCDIFERGLDQSEAEQPAGERFPRFGLDYHVTVLLRLYERSESPSVRNRCLDIIDRLSWQTASRAERVLDSYSGRML